MLDKRKIKKVIRVGLPETNSSSSHSVSINLSNDLIMPGDPRFNLKIRKGILYVPEYKSTGSADSFGWETEKYNDPKTKLQYVCGILCTDYESRSGLIKIAKFKRLLRSILGVKDIKFEWDTKFSKDLKKYRDKHKNGYDEEDDSYPYRNCPEINHNSHDIFEEIIESPETIKKFIFNPKSWLYLGNDNSDYPKFFYEESWVEFEEDKPEYYGYIEFPDPIGRLDFDIPYMDFYDGWCSKESLLSNCTDLDDLLSELKYDPVSGTMVTFTRSYTNKNDHPEYLSYLISDLLDDGQGNFSILYVNKKMEDLFVKTHIEISGKYEISGKSDIGARRFTRDEAINIFLKDIINSDASIEGVDYMYFPIHFESDKLGFIC